MVLRVVVVLRMVVLRMDGGKARRVELVVRVVVLVGWAVRRGRREVRRRRRVGGDMAGRLVGVVFIIQRVWSVQRC